jgi:hypothetical protein
MNTRLTGSLAKSAARYPSSYSCKWPKIVHLGHNTSVRAIEEDVDEASHPSYQEIQILMAVNLGLLVQNTVLQESLTQL